MNRILEAPEIEEWLTTERIFLMLKDKEKGSESENYRPIACLLTAYKLLTGIIANQIYSYLERNNLLPAEWNECCKNSEGMKDQLLTDKLVLKN